ncbi:hypothetical protein AD998_11580 [bacterium 336/3]|nr:hypothetical protein AD998_11580 [bacterium 336/3]
MEKPYNGRAIIHENSYELEIIIPIKKNWFLIIFFGAWLCSGWVIGEMIGIIFFILTVFIKELYFNLFILFWLCFWTVSGFFIFKIFLWNAFGKEVFTFKKGTLTIRKKGLLLSQPKIYNIQEVKKIRVEQEESTSDKLLYRKNLIFSHTNGTIRFSYGLQDVKFGDGIDEAEAYFILEKLKSKKILTDENF